MKIRILFYAVSLVFISSHNFAQKTDTLHVFQNDEKVFEKKVFLTRLHYSPIPFANANQSKFQINYVLINPQIGAYYFIYNDKKQLVTEGLYALRASENQGKINENGAFYDSKTYRYKKNGSLISIHYQLAGRNFKTAYYDRKKRLKKITYYNLKSSDTEKIEIYQKGKLKETRIYTSFKNYYKVKATT